jgi:hypothetical protein
MGDVGSPQFTDLMYYRQVADLALDNFNTPYITVSDSSYGFYVLRYINATWENLGSPGFHDGGAALTINKSDNLAYVVLNARGTQRAEVKQYYAGYWVKIANAGTGIYTRDPALILIIPESR